MPCFVEFMALQHPNNNVHNLRVVRLMVTGGALPPSQLLDTGAMDMVRAQDCCCFLLISPKLSTQHIFPALQLQGHDNHAQSILQVAEVLMYTYNNQVALFKEPVLELCAALLAAYLPSTNGRPSPFGAAAAEGARLEAQSVVNFWPCVVTS